MAITYSKIAEASFGNQRGWLGTVTFDSSYVTGGEPYTVGNFGLASVVNMMLFDSASGYTFQHDRTNKKILAYRQSPSGTVAAPTLTVTGGQGAGIAVQISADTDAAVIGKTTATTRTGITGIQAPAFTGTGAAMVEVSNAVDLSLVVVNVFVLGS